VTLTAIMAMKIARILHCQIGTPIFANANADQQQHNAHSTKPSQPVSANAFVTLLSIMVMKIAQIPQSPIGTPINVFANAIRPRKIQQLTSLNGTYQLAATSAIRVKQLVDQDNSTQVHALVELEPQSQLFIVVGA